MTKKKLSKILTKKDIRAISEKLLDQIDVGDVVMTYMMTNRHDIDADFSDMDVADKDVVLGPGMEDLIGKTTIEVTEEDHADQD